MDGMLFQVFIYLCGAVIAVPTAKRLGLGSVLGYLIAGIILGPLVGLLGAEAHQVQEFAEFGVVMMLFLVGLELKPSQLWDMRHRLFGLGGLQVAATALLVGGAVSFFGATWTVALTIGLIATGSSTAIVLQTLSERGLIKTDGGRAIFSALLFQDISVIPILALLPLLATSEFSGGAMASAHDQGMNFLQTLPVWAATLATIGSVVFVVVGGHFLARPLFRFISSAQLREVFTAAALLLVVGIALLMTLVGLSPALGTFLAGVVLANSEYRHELESDIEPFKGLLLGVFFTTVGAGVNFSLLFEQWPLVIGATLGLMASKMAVLWAIATSFQLRGTDRWLFALGLAQIGEFAFVLVSFATQNAVLPEAIAEILLIIVALSMLFTPILFIVYDRLVLPFQMRQKSREADTIDAKGLAIIAGIGRFGQIVNRMLRSNGYETVVLDLSAETLDTLARFGIKAFFGDAARPDLLEAAGLSEATLLVVAIDDREHATSIVKFAKRVRPDIRVVARAYDRIHVYELFNAGCDDIVRETFDGAVRAGRYSLEALGVHPHEVEKLVRTFVRNDRKSMRKLAELYDPELPPTANAAYMAMAKQVRAEEDAMMQVSKAPARDAARRAWLPPDTSSEG